MEKGMQKSECGSGSTGTTFKVLMVLSSAFFLFPENFLVGAVSAISSLLMGRRVKAFLPLSAAIVIHEVSVLYDSIVFRFSTLAVVLLIGCAVIERFSKTLAVCVTAVTVAMAAIAAFFFLLKLGSADSCVGVVYIYLLLFSWIFGLFFLVVNYFGCSSVW